MKTIVAFGNPLLDTTVNIKNSFLLDKYNLEKDGQKEVDEKTMRSICEDISPFNKTLSAGGCGQNTLRVIQWLLNKQFSTYIFGAVGNDTNADVLKRLLENDGVQTRYSMLSNFFTGTTVALVNAENRSLVAHIGAAENYSLTDLLSSDYEDIIMKSDLVYIEGFFLTKRSEVAKYVLDFCNTKNRLVVFNLSGEYLVEVETTMAIYFAKNADIIFGNKREYNALCKFMDAQNINSLVKLLVQEHKPKNDFGKIIVITDGPKDVMCYHSIDKVEIYEVPKLNSKDNIDTTGAGDAFVSGFIAGLMLEKTPNECSKIGCFSALNLIKQAGCTLPNFQPNLNDILSN